MFTGDEFADGGDVVRNILKRAEVKGSFFFTGRFYRNPAFGPLITGLKEDGHYLGSHSDQHLLYCDWKKRDSLFVTEKEFKKDLKRSYQAMLQFGIKKKDASFFLPPYEWYNRQIADWTRKDGLTLINFTPGTRSNADYTYPELGRSYLASDAIYRSILSYEQQNNDGLNGFILLLHVGTDSRRTDKFYNRLGDLIKELKTRGYEFKRIDDLLRM